LLALVVVFGILAGSIIPIYYLILMLALWLILRYSVTVSAILQSIARWPYLRVVLLGFLAVIAEETLVALLYSIEEGFSVSLWMVRAGQFIFFNVFAFAGLVLGFYPVVRFGRLSLRAMFLMIGIWGLFSEGIIPMFGSNPIAAVILFLPTMLVYFTIFLPAYLSMPDYGTHRRFVPTLLSILAGWLLCVLLSIPFLTVLGNLRTSSPDIFPNCEYIRCAGS